MSLPISGSGPRGPHREPTHKALDHRKLLNLGLAVEDSADGDEIRCDALDQLALEEGVDTSHLYAAVAIATELEIARENPVVFIACAGNCQHWGALECIEHLATLRLQRSEAGEPGFDIQAKKCLDRCEHAPVVVVHTRDGKALIDRATTRALSEAVAQTCE